MNNKILFVAIAVIVVVGGMILLSNKKGSETVPITTEQPTTSIQPTSTDKTGEQTQEAAVTITSSGFEPATITIKVGTKVAWTNKSGGDVTINSAIHPTHLVYPPLNLWKFPEGKVVELVFDKQGTYKYHDHLNPSRTGTVVVE